MTDSPELLINRQHELEARKLGMRSLDPAEIARQFDIASVHRELIKKERLRVVGGPAGTKGASAEVPK